MTLSYDEAAAQITAPGERYETTTANVGGIEYTVFKGAPETLRDLFDLTRLYDQTGASSTPCRAAFPSSTNPTGKSPQASAPPKPNSWPASSGCSRPAC